MWLNHI